MSDPVAPAAESGPPPLWIGSVVIECHDFGRMLAFWSEALGYRPRRPPTADWVVLEDPTGRGPNVSLTGPGGPPDEDYRFHFDLYTTRPLAEVERLVRLGARVRQAPSPGHDFVTLEDPDGNPFDVIDVTWPGVREDWWFGRAEGAPPPVPGP